MLQGPDYGAHRPGTPRSPSVGPEDEADHLASVLSPDHLEMLELCRSWKQELMVDSSAASSDHAGVFQTFKEVGTSFRNQQPQTEAGVDAVSSWLKSDASTSAPLVSQILSLSAGGSAPVASVGQPTPSPSSPVPSPTDAFASSSGQLAERQTDEAGSRPSPIGAASSPDQFPSPPEAPGALKGTGLSQPFKTPSPPRSDSPRAPRPSNSESPTLPVSPRVSPLAEFSSKTPGSAPSFAAPTMGGSSMGAGMSKTSSASSRAPRPSMIAQHRRAPSSPRSPRAPLSPEQLQKENLQLRQAEIELELSPSGKQQLVACQVSPTSWLHITQGAANEFQTLNNLVKDTRQLVQQQAAFDVEKHRHQVAAYLGGKLGMMSFMYLLEMAEKPWQEPLCSLSKEALESLVSSQYIDGVTLMLLRAACYHRRSKAQKTAVRLLISSSVNSNSRALVRAALHSEGIAACIAEQLVRVHLDTGHAHYVLLLEQLCTETASTPSCAHKFLQALESTHKTYSEKCTDGSSDNYLDYHDVQTALCAASLAYIKS